MSFQAKFLASLLVFGAVSAFGIASADSLKDSRSVRSTEAPRATIHEAVWTATPANLSTNLKSGTAHVANAVRELDLSKLTMADFGDVDPNH